jgi:PTH1 family peptidyl-tRNA hydrolase
LKYLIAGLGNPGDEYAQTRHNIGFLILDAFAKASNISFSPGRYASQASLKFKGRTFILIKPTTFMNLSGKAVQYWMQQEKIPIENILVIVDDLALPFGTLRMKGKGSDGSHNGLSSIQECLQSNAYPRLRFGIGSEFSKGRQVDYVLGNWNDEEKKTLNERIEMSVEMIKSFGTAGLGLTMTQYNNK